MTDVFHKDMGGADLHTILGAPGLAADDQHVLDDEVLAVAEDKTKKGAASGYAPLDATSKVPIANLPDIGGVPTGSIVAYGGIAAPSGWLLCQGAAVSRTTYAALFAILGTAYGVGDGSTTFNLPDLQQRFPLGKAASGTGSTLGGIGGAIDHTHTGPSHTHTLPTISGYDGLAANYQLNAQATGAAGTGATGTNNPPFQAVNYIIKT